MSQPSGWSGMGGSGTHHGHLCPVCLHYPAHFPPCRLGTQSRWRSGPEPPGPLSSSSSPTFSCRVIRPPVFLPAVATVRAGMVTAAGFCAWAITDSSVHRYVLAEQLLDTRTTKTTGIPAFEELTFDAFSEAAFLASWKPCYLTQSPLLRART